MSDLFLLSEAQIARIALHFPLSHGVPRVDDRRQPSEGASQPATIDAPIPSSQPCPSPQPSHSGIEQRVL